ncbi:type III pantothenate kinase [Candidatus Thioglobus sp.]|uniref:type III pantothenate kinase n=1 Tax=Candidatus Thioglobus sp. TaxID=2026721 RepID=UPI0026328442|nr:type III pantothenate kinase [Candidatus Thioglobus sp.]MDG2395008.1 type III pantothenate kinase [Candidatus Thioglobus sp.]
MYNLYIDIGNTAVKWLFNGEYQSVLVADFSIDLLPQASRVHVSCVGDKSVLGSLDNTTFVRSQATFASFKSAYDSPQDLGIDRFLAMIAAIDQLPNQNILIIDVGSACTFDLVLASGEHQGGLIMPGLGVLRRSFDQFSSQSKNITLESLASNTIDGWEYGTSQMLMSVITAQIENHQSKLGELQVLLTGGDAKMVAYRLNQSVIIKQNLVLEGLALYAQSHN